MDISQKKGYILLIFMIIIMLILGITIYNNLQSKNAKLEEKVQDINSKYVNLENSCNANMSLLNEKINLVNSEKTAILSQLNELNKSYLSQETKLVSLTGKYASLNEEVDSTLDKLEQYQTEVQSSMSWFNTNSNLDSVNIAKNNLDFRCLRSEDNVCSIKTACFHLVNSEFFDLNYKTDFETSNNDDKLQDLNSFIFNEGGDCEDYALFFKAEWNYLISQCSNKDITYNIDTYYFDSSNNQRVYSDYSKSWYFTNNGVTELQFTDYIYPSVVCGNMYDLNSGDINGHCIIALTKEKILESEDLKYLDKAVLIEPQNGAYMGLLNDNSPGIYLLGYNSPEYINSFVYQVITDDDHYLYSENNGWESYGDYDSEIVKHIENLNRIK